MPLLPSLARMFPELSELAVAMNGYGREAAALWASMRAVPTFSDGLRFARLRKLELNHATTYDTTLSTTQLSALLNSVLAATPKLEQLTVFVGQVYSRAKPPLPGLGGALAHLPPTITSLEFSEIDVRDTGLCDCSLPQLRTLALHNCQGDCSSLVARARDEFPSLCDARVTDWKSGRKPFQPLLPGVAA